MKKSLLSLMLIVGSLHGASITNTVDHIVNVRGPDAPIISQSSITASNMFLFGSGTSPSNVVVFSQLSGSTNTLSGIFVPTNRVLSVVSPITGGGALNADRSFGFDGSSSFNASGATNLNGSAIASGTVAFPRLPVGTLTNIVAGSGIGSSYSAGVYTLTSSGAFSTSFTSTDQTITSGSMLTLAHGLAGIPRAVFSYIRCTSADQGYSVNDIILMPAVATGVNNCGITLQVDATNVYVIIGNIPQVMAAHNRSTFATTTLDNTKWVVFIQAYY